MKTKVNKALLPRASAMLALTATLLMGAGITWAQNAAVVNGKPISNARLDAFIAQATKSGMNITPEIKGQIKEELIMREIFAQEAEKRGLGFSEDVKQQMDLARQNILVRELLAEHAKKNPISEADIKAEYDRFVKANSGKEYKASHILVETEEKAKAVLASLKKGEKFEAVAKKVSKDPGSGSKGGDLGWSVPSNYVPEFAQALTKLEKGQVSTEPVKTQFGYHILRVDDTRAATLPKLEEVKPQIEQKLRQDKLVKFQQELRKAADVK